MDLPANNASNSTDDTTQAGSGGRSNKRLPWDTPVLLPLDIGRTEGTFADFGDEDDFKNAS